jgi:short subunit dehydrogenase-like uncharacterized protein
VVCTTVGPYAKYGTELVKACARAGTHYCDLTGEVHWMRAMIDDHGDEASASGASIVFTCGFDSIPSDLGVYFVQQEMQRRHGVPCARVKLRVNGASGGASGGTIASMLNMMEEAKNDPEVMRVTNEPYAINPKDQRSGPDGPDARGPVYDADFGAWTAPFMMAGINTKVVRRSNALLGYAYGKGFRYDESTLTGPGPIGFAKAAGVAAATTGGMVAMAIAPIRNAVADRLPQPGEGPSPEARKAGYWDLSALGLHPDDPAKNVRARLTGDRDPGYGSTAKMLGESAVCLAEAERGAPGGMLTPASAMGDALIERLREHAGITFELEDEPSR